MLFALACVCVVLILCLYVVTLTGVGTERIRNQAELALQRALGGSQTATIGPTQIALDGAQLIALEMRDVKVESGGKTGIEAGEVRFGVRLLPLLRGNLRLGTATLTDAKISLSALQMKRSGDWTTELRNEDGLIDPDLVGEALFKSLHNAFAGLERSGAQELRIVNSELVIAEQGRVRNLLVRDATLREDGGKLTLSAEAALDGREISLSGSTVHGGADDRISSLSLSLDIAAAEEVEPDSEGFLSDDGGKSRLGAAKLEITGSETEGRPARLALSADLTDAILDLGRRGYVRSNGKVDASLEVGANKLEIDHLLFSTGRSTIDLSGAFGPKPSDAGGAPLYRYEFVTNSATVAPVDSPEAPVPFSARMAGTFDEKSMRLTADQLAVRTDSGQILASGALDFVSGKSPGIAMAVSTKDMPVAQVKQFWPWIAAARARSWAMLNFFGGQVVEGGVEYRVAPGRLGDGIPLHANEVSGRFQVSDTRFDTTGDLPAIRDAYGAIEFRGNDVDISLERGTAFLPSGKQIAVGNGTMAIRNSNVPPVIGDLQLDVSGDADAGAELASLNPINGTQRLGLVSTDFSGRFSGKIKVQVPFQKDVDRSTIEWLADLGFENLAIAKPFDGQLVTAAKGRLLIDPRHAEVTADAALNGVPAKLTIVEPFRGAEPAKKRDIVLQLDGKRLVQMAPGLKGLVSGPVNLKVDASNSASGQRIEGDLKSATLMLPWVGWSKGPGVPATVAFTMKRDGAATNLNDFKVGGDTFEISGSVKLQDGGLSSATFDTVRLNRDDDARVSIARKGKALAVNVNAGSFDGRALIKMVMGPSAENSDSSDSSGPVTLTASLDRVAGFNGRSLSNVKLDYSSGASPTYALSAATQNGGAVSIRSAPDGGQQVMTVNSADGGALMAFLDIYEHMEGGTVGLTLSGKNSGSMSGRFDARNFVIVGEERLGSIVSSTPDGGDRSLSQAVRRDIDTSRVTFERAFSGLQKSPGYLKLDGGVLRGSTIGATFQGVLYDQNGNMNMTGTFMPAYGINRIFGELPLIGAILGNGRDRGLIGVTFKLQGKTSKPALEVNPLSIIAPGIFRQIFEY